MFFKPQWLITLSLFCISPSYGYQIDLVELFTSKPVVTNEIDKFSKNWSTFEVRIYNLNQVSELEKEYSKGLSENQIVAEKQIERLITEVGGRENFNKTILNAYKPLTRATEIGLLEYPALVINERYVVYGTDNIGVGIERFKAWKNSSRK